MNEKILTEEDINYAEVRDYIVFLIAKIGGEKGLSHKGIHKTCYIVKDNLGKSIEINNQLPFYWYFFGPYSNVIEQAISLAIEEDLIEEKTIEDRFKLLFLKDLKNYTEPKIKDLDKINEIILKFKINPFEIEKLTEFIYRKAPRIFRYNFYTTIQNINYYNDFLNRSKINQDKIFGHAKKQITNSLYTSEGTLPREVLFKNYNILYSSYVTTIQRFLNQKRQFNFEMLEHLNEIVTISYDVWERFGEGERILSHDAYLPYENSIQKWKTIYYSHLESLRQNLKIFDDHIISVIGLENLNKDYSIKEKLFLRTVLQ